MPVVRFNPLRGFESMGRRINEFVNEFEKGVNFEVGGFNPRVDISEDAQNLRVHAEVPGIKKEDIKISINEDRVLTIKGIKKRDEKDGEKSFLRTERVFGEFSRTLVLPENIEVEKISARYDNGVLELSMPKIEPPKPKEIEVHFS